MKNLSVILLSILLCAFASAQIPNSGFEEWEMDGNKEEPKEWATNSISNPPWCYSVEKTHDCWTGQYAARVKTIECGFEGFMPGWMTVTFLPNQVYNKLSYGCKLVSITAPAFVEISVSEQLPNGTIQMLGKKVYETIPNHYFNYKSFTFSASTANRPMIIKVSSNTVSNGTFNLGYAEWIVADLELSFSTVDVDDEIKNEMILYPNPASTKTHLRLPGNNTLLPAEMQVFDSWGRMVLNRKIETELSDIDITSLSKGSYILRIFNSQIILSKKLIVY